MKALRAGLAGAWLAAAPTISTAERLEGSVISDPVDGHELRQAWSGQERAHLDLVGVRAPSDGIALWSAPASAYGQVVGRLARDQRMGLRGHWTAEGLEGHQGRVGIPGTVRVEGRHPIGRPGGAAEATVWAHVPARWVLGGRTVRRVPVPGRPWTAVPVGNGAELGARDGRVVVLRGCASVECAAIGRLGPGDGRGRGGRMVWPEAPAGTPAGWRLAEAAGLVGYVRVRDTRAHPRRLGRVLDRLWGGSGRVRSCVRLVFGSGGYVGRCAAGARRRMRDPFERGYDRLDPVLGRVGHAELAWIDAAAARERADAALRRGAGGVR